MTDSARLKEHFAGPEWDWLRKRIRKSFEQDHSLPQRFGLQRPSPGERRAILALLGRSQQVQKGQSLSFTRGEFETILRDAGLCATLREWIEVLEGPIVPRAALRRAREEAWAELRKDWTRVPSDADAFFQGLRRLASQDPAEGERLLADLNRLLEGVLAEDQLPTRTAARLFGDSHALDGDRPLTRLLALHAGCEPGNTRALWPRFGLTPDEVSSTVLCLGIRFAGDSPIARASNALADAGIPQRLLLRHFRETLRPGLRRASVFVCENPAVLEAAAEAGVRAALICTEGQPSHACVRLLDACVAVGAALQLRADFDWSGVRIANFLWRRYPGSTTWHFDAETYAAFSPGPVLFGDPVETPWDPNLSLLMEKTGHAIHEEQLLHLLIQSLGG